MGVGGWVWCRYVVGECGCCVGVKEGKGGMREYGEGGEG